MIISYILFFDFIIVVILLKKFLNFGFGCVWLWMNLILIVFIGYIIIIVSVILVFSLYNSVCICDNLFWLFVKWFFRYSNVVNL